MSSKWTTLEIYIWIVVVSVYKYVKAMRLSEINERTNVERSKDSTLEHINI